jgi:hypothetical protein
MHFFIVCVYGSFGPWYESVFLYQSGIIFDAGVGEKESSTIAIALVKVIMLLEIISPFIF